jgi:cardiolipin synthase
VALLTNTVLGGGNRVELALDGDGTFPRLWDDLRSAQQSIVIQNYYKQSGYVADTLGRILLERAAAGVRILLLYDAFGTSSISAERLAAFRAAGIQAVPFRPFRLSTLWVVQNRSHVRAIVIDGQIGWTGGFGIDDKWLGDGRTNGAWRETNVRFAGPAVLQLEAAFAAAWAEATGVLITGRTTPNPHADGVTMAGLLHTSPTLGSTAAERFLALSIAGAQRTLYITNAYFAPDHNFVDLLVRAARRDVDVRLLVGGPRTDIRMARQAGRARYERLLAAGVRIYEWQPSTLHAKTFVVDGLWSSVGDELRQPVAGPQRRGDPHDPRCGRGPAHGRSLPRRPPLGPGDHRGPIRAAPLDRARRRVGRRLSHPPPLTDMAFVDREA